VVSLERAKPPSGLPDDPSNFLDDRCRVEAAQAPLRGGPLGLRMVGEQHVARAVAPMASMYQRSVRSYRVLRLAGFAAGYLLAWAGAGIPAFLLTALVARLVDDHPAWATAAAVVVFAACGVYQLTPLKSRCLKHCRSPLSLLLHYGAYRGALRDVRAGAHHGAYCLGCCWSLMALFVVVGVMNLVAMVVLAVVVLVEKLWMHGRCGRGGESREWAHSHASPRALEAENPYERWLCPADCYWLSG
jgi:hypothetical protein